MSEWQPTTWGEVITLQRGFDITKKDQALSGHVPVVSSSGIGSHHDHAMAQGPGVVIGRKGTLGRVYFVDVAYWPHDTTLWVKDFKGNDPKFVFYALQRLDVSYMNVGTASPTLNRNHVHPIPVLWPADTAEQRRVAATLSSFDDKIQSNQRAMCLLEDLGAAFLEEALVLDAYGFPEYDPVRTLGDFLSVLETGSRPKGGVTSDGVGVVSLGAESVQSAGVISTEKFKLVPLEYADRMRRGRLLNEDILVYKDGGKPGNFIPHISAFGYGFPVEEAVINEHVYRARAIDGVTQGLLYWLLRSPWMDLEMRKRGTGVAIPGLNSTNFRNLPMPILTRDALDILNSKLSPMLAALLRYGAESSRLKAVRDALLPELLSGKLRVPEAAGEFVGASSGILT